jgi:hypothetical protein
MFALARRDECDGTGCQYGPAEAWSGTKFQMPASGNENTPVAHFNVIAK